MRLYLPLCMFDRHWPDRGSARWDGTHYVTTCRVCGKQIRRDNTRRWRRDWLGGPAA